MYGYENGEVKVVGQPRIPGMKTERLSLCVNLYAVNSRLPVQELNDISFR